MIPTEKQPDQTPQLWDDHVLVYQEVFESFSLGFAKTAVDRLKLDQGARILDVGCGSGGVALALARSGHLVTAIDAAPRMIERLVERSVRAEVTVDAEVMDGQALTYEDATFDAGLSVFGVILFPDAIRGLAELNRVVRPGGRIAVVTWTDPPRYELAARLRTAISTVRPEQQPAPLPAQLRYREEADFKELFRQAGLAKVEVEKVDSLLVAPSARWLAERIAFAPGMAAMTAGLGSDLPAIMTTFVDELERSQGRGEVQLSGVAFVGHATVE